MLPNIQRIPNEYEDQFQFIDPKEKYIKWNDLQSSKRNTFTIHQLESVNIFPYSIQRNHSVKNQPKSNLSHDNYYSEDPYKRTNLSSTKLDRM